MRIWQTLRAAVLQDVPSRPQRWYLAVDVLRMAVMGAIAVRVYAFGTGELWLPKLVIALALVNAIGALLVTLRYRRMTRFHRWLPWTEGTLIAAFLVATGAGATPYLPLMLVHSFAVTLVYGSLIGAMVSVAFTLFLLGLALRSPLPNPIDGLMTMLALWAGYSALSLLNSAATRAFNEARAQASRAQELQSLNEAKYQFINIVSHELRTPLTVINGYGKLLQSGMIGTEPGELQDVSREISKAADRMGLLIDELLDFGRLQSGTLPLKPERFTYGELVQDVVHVLGVLASEKDQRLSLSLTSREIAITADPRRIEQVLINLLHNALKYSPEKTEVRVAVRLEDDRVRTEVQDDGPGITPDHLAHLFTPFYRAGLGNRRVDVEGIGLGLAICHGIVAAHGGQIGVESAPGRGSRFWFDLPVARAGDPVPVEV